jgi:hypothetical protein
MKFRTGLVIGFGLGYYLGARAGRERYIGLLDDATGGAASTLLDLRADEANHAVDAERDTAFDEPTA